MENKLPGWKIPAPIPSINLGVSIDTFYNFKKWYSGGFTWSFEIERDELYPVECDLLDFLAEQTVKNQFDSMQCTISCMKIGGTVQCQFLIEYVKKTEKGWKIGNTY